MQQQGATCKAEPCTQSQTFHKEDTFEHIADVLVAPGKMYHLRAGGHVCNAPSGMSSPEARAGEAQQTVGCFCISSIAIARLRAATTVKTWRQLGSSRPRMMTWRIKLPCAEAYA